MLSTVDTAVPKKPEGFFEEAGPRLLTHPAAVRTLLRFMNPVVVCSLSPATVSDMARALKLPVARVAYQVKQLLKHDLLRPLGKPGRGQQYVSSERWVIPHTALPQGNMEAFLTEFYKRVLPRFAAAFEQQLAVQAQPWQLVLDFSRAFSLEFQATHGESQRWPPLIASPLVRLTPAQADALHAELQALLARYDALSAPQPTPGYEDYYLGLVLARGLN